MAGVLFSLPERYHLGSEIDLEKDGRLALILNAAALFLTCLAFLALVWLAALLKRIPQQASFTLRFDLEALTAVIIVIMLMAGGILAHEAIHGAFFWFFSGKKPAFGLGLSYAYAAAPECYFPRRFYALVGLAPLIVIDLITLALLFTLPPFWFLPLALLTAFNTGGSIGDLWIVWRLMRHPRGALVHDDGHRISFFVPVSPTGG